MRHAQPFVTITGSEALAQGAIDAGVRYVTGYPGSPATATFEHLLRLADPDVQIEWASNEKSAFDQAFGATLAGVRALVCVKSVGMNVALDSLMVSNLAAGDGGFVILAGDDPGGWGSQNEQDSRPLVASAEVPLLEPITTADARPTMREAFALSEGYRVPVVVRITRALAGDRVGMPSGERPIPSVREASFRRQADRFCVLPIRVVELHARLQATLEAIRAIVEASPRNCRRDGGDVGCIATGFAYQKLSGLAGHSSSPPLSTLGLGTLNPLPERLVADFMALRRAILVLEEGAPLIETQIRSLAHRSGPGIPILGRLTGHVPSTGELDAQQIGRALGALTGTPVPVQDGGAGREMPSLRPLCDGCPYVPIFRALLTAMERLGGRDAFIVTGETGCMVRGQLPPFELLDVKYGMGSSIGLAAGLARSGVRQRIVALSGDSALLHSGLAELVDACQAGVRLAVVVLANETTALSGGQPHAATGLDARGRRRHGVDLQALIKAAGPGLVAVVDPHDAPALRTSMAGVLDYPGVAVLISQRGCPAG